MPITFLRKLTGIILHVHTFCILFTQLNLLEYAGNISCVSNYIIRRAPDFVSARLQICARKYIVLRKVHFCVSKKYICWLNIYKVVSATFIDLFPQDFLTGGSKKISLRAQEVQQTAATSLGRHVAIAYWRDQLGEDTSTRQTYREWHLWGWWLFQSYVPDFNGKIIRAYVE